MSSPLNDHLPTPLSYRPFAFFVNVKAGLRAACFLRVDGGSVYASPAQFALLVLCGALLQFVNDYLQTGGDGVFVAVGLGGLLLNVPLVLLAAWGITAFFRRPQALAAVAVLLLATMLVIDYGMLFMEYMLDYVPGYTLRRGSARLQQLLDHYGFLVRLLWLVLACALATVRLLDLRFPALGQATAVLALLLAAPFTQIYIDRTLWAAPHDYAPQARQELQAEDVFYLQPQLLQSRLAALQASPGGRPALYFLGVAGYAGQDVFMKEVNYVRSMFDRRFGTTGHSLILVNNPKSVRETPIASVSSMQMSLNRIGQLMDKDRDVLFLYLSSHGSHDHTFTLEFDSMQFYVLNPQRLRAMLDASGIRNRVIVVSACYSGGFIDALKTDDTLVITAAAADKTSFGCSNEADFTYFGKAYFEEALNRTDSFIVAYDLALPGISARERAQGFEHSDPGIFVGKNIESRLQQLPNPRP
ncbi:C13 family peptidase [Undibacterium sp. TJN25]|uniref:C13 family peptidase n=1 Tax=Undibacterium sp. TJN25 TaxID=3413056 RepID=UPI003BF2F7AD